MNKWVVKLHRLYQLSLIYCLLRLSMIYGFADSESKFDLCRRVLSLGYWEICNRTILISAINLNVVWKSPTELDFEAITCFFMFYYGFEEINNHTS